LSEYRDDVERSYKRVAENLVAFGKMGWKRRLSPLIPEVAEGRRPLTLGAEPRVGLVIFGFDKPQQDDPSWKGRHLARLKENIKPVVDRGEAKGVSLKL
jgi:hypothetical protein